ncbi:MAG: SDR family oxidoreductase [Deltaproteobacteria bacterium]|jgi:NAD(P)-dependent dehydrogenase (short-subunit alcohol dehydrogenase family)|nr:SDR family oxidoreductase [Deltaproteobacteria bacterium]
MKNLPTAVVTGGAQGIGLGIARRLLDSEYQVFIWDKDFDAGQEAVSMLATIGDVQFIPCDISKEEQVLDALAQLKSLAGGLDLLVNNAGVANFKSLDDMTLDEWNAVIGTNLTGPFLCSKYCAPLLRESQGAIVNICSTRAHMSEPGTESYSASKGGVLALTHALAISLGPEVRVNCISPGWIDLSTQKQGIDRNIDTHSDADHAQHPVGRIGTPEDIAEMTLFLASEKAGFITGQEIIVDGGMTRKMIYI